MKKVLALTLAAACVTATTALAASCGSTASTPFSETEIKGTGTLNDYVHTVGDKVETISSEVEKTYYRASVTIMNVSEAPATLLASDFTVSADGIEYTCDGFFRLKKTNSEKTNVTETSYDISTTISLKDFLTEKTFEQTIIADSVNLSVPLTAIPESYSISYKGKPLTLAPGAATKIAEEKYMVDENLYIALDASVADESKAAAINSFDIGTVVSRYTSVNETKLNATYHYVNVQATVGTEDVTVYANKFTLKLNGNTYTSMGFASSGTKSDTEGSSTSGVTKGLLTTTVTVTLKASYTIGHSEVGQMNVAFDVEIGDSAFEIYYDGVKLS